jgi:predicted  nucleic acid-binding Zn-ribbon protein
MNKQENSGSHLFKDLKALSASSFPKKCSSCGEVYESSEQFVLKTADIGGRSGLKSSEDDDGDHIVELFRNCVCGSTLMECFNDRRDLSRAGLKRRELFGRLMAMLEKKGLPADQARPELLKLIHGEHSRVLEQLGIKFKSA